MHFTPAAIARRIEADVYACTVIGTPVLGGFNGRAQLGLGEGGRVERAVGRRYPPARR